MSKTYVIQWKSKVNGRAGKGTKLFEFEEAEALAAELNEEYPEIDHRVVNAGETVQALESAGSVVGPAGESQSESNQEPAENPTKVLALAG
jgi:hypothetical protein